MESQFVALTPYENFVFALKAKESKRQYPNRLNKFFTFIGLQGTIEEKSVQLYELSKNDVDILQSYLIRFITSQKERIENKEIAEGTLRNYIKAIKLFFSMNDIIVNWKKLSKGIPQVYSKQDRIPTIDEIKKLLEHPDRRIKPIVLTMISAGIRVGSWDYLKWRHITPILRNDVLVAAKIVLKNTKINREYFSFITPEAYYSLKDWMHFRKLHGENVSGESWLIRDTWQKVDKNHGHRIGLAKYPQKFGATSIRNMIHEAWKVQGIRDKISDPQVKRHEFKSTHSFRKIFETKCQLKMNHNNIKLLMDHSLGESQNYHRPTEQELLDDYLNAVDLLTINDEFRLKKKIEVLEVEKSQLETIAKDVAFLKRKYNKLKN